MIYTVCSWNDSYSFHHSDVGTAWHFADALISTGRAATVLWGGEAAMVHGVPHENYHVARPSKEDIIVAFGGSWRAAIEGRDAYTGAFEGWKDAMRRGDALGAAFDNLRVPQRKWWYAYDYAGGDLAGVWEHVFVESYVRTDLVQARTPDAKVHCCMPGVVHEVDLSTSSPYPNGIVPLFFAGRLMAFSPDWHEGQLHFMSKLIDLLPTKYHLYIVSASVTVPTGPPEMLTGVPIMHVGKTMHIIGAPGTAAKVLGPTETSVGAAEGKEIVSTVLGNNERIHFMGPQPYQSFWNYYHHAHMCLDFGLIKLPPAPNCKVLDPLRAGTAVLADGLSPIHYLIHMYRAGTVVPYRDANAAADAIVSWPLESLESKLARARCVVEAESWHTRILRIINDTGI